MPIGNPVPVADAAWVSQPASLGALSATAGASTVLTAAATPATGSVTATVGAAVGSAAVTVAAPASAPGSPVQLTAATAASRGVSLAGRRRPQGQQRGDGYRVYRGSSSGAETLLASVGNVLAYTDTSARRGATYYYEVVAVNAAGRSAVSNEASARAR